MDIKRYRYCQQKLTEIDPVLAEIVYSRKVRDEDGTSHPLKSEISREEMFFLFDHIRTRSDCRRVLEIGCAMGVSSLVISAALKKKQGDTFHLICDPWQETVWRKIGLRNLEKAGYRNIECWSIGSESALPRLYERREQFDFVFQDGMHTFDHAMMEFFYIDRIIRVGGTIVYDDVDVYSINRFIRFVSLYPHWKIVACVGVPAWGIGRRLANLFKWCLYPVICVLPRNIAIEFVSDSVLRPDRALGLNSSMLALEKTAEFPNGYLHKEKF